MPIYTIETPGGRKLKIEAANEADAMRGAKQWHAENGAAKPVGPVFQPGKDFAAPIAEAFDRVKADALWAGPDPKSNPLKQIAVDIPLHDVRMALNLGGLVLSPLAGLSNQLTSPASRALVKAGLPVYEKPAAPWSPGFGKAPRRLEGADAVSALKGQLDTALMGLRPGATGVKPLPARVAKPLEPDVRAARAIERAQARDRLAGEIPQGAPGAMPIHQGGENLTAMADVLANSPGPGRGVIRRAARDYEARAVDRTKADIARDLGGRNDFFETQNAMIAQRKAAADEGMAAMADAPVSLDENAIMALRSDLAKTAIRERARNALASPDPDVRAQGAALNRLADEVLDNPAGAQLTLRDAQDISRTLQQQATAAYRAGDGGRGEALSTLGKAIRSNAADPQRGGVQGYADWLKRYGDDISREEALQAGRDVFGGKQNAEQLRMAVDNMGETERALFQKGVGEALLAKVRGTRGDVGALRDMLNSEENASRLALAFPDDQAFANFMESAARRVSEREVNNRILGGSPTDPRMAARADLEAEGFDPLAAAGDVVTGNIGGLARGAAREAIKKLPRKSRSVIGDPDTNLALARALTNEDEMTRVLNSLNAARARDARLRAVLQRAAPLLLETGAASPEGPKTAR